MIAAARPGIRHQVVTRHAVLSDNFNRADSTSVINPASDGNSWTREAGTWGISSNRGYMSSITGGGTARTGGGYISISTDPGFSQVDIKVTNTRANNAGFSAIMFAADTSPSGNALVLRHDAFNSALIAWDGTTSTTLASGFLTAWTGGSTDLRITYDPTTGAVNILQNGTPKLAYTVASLYRYTGTVIALGSQVSTAGEFWDDFNVSGTLPTIFNDNFNRATSTTTLGSPWTASGDSGATSVWGIDSNQARCVSSSGGTGIAYITTTSADFDMSVTWTVVDTRSGPMFRGNSGLTSWFRVQPNGAVTFVSGGSGTTIVPDLTSNHFSNGDRIRITGVGSLLTFYRNGVIYAQVTNSNNVTETRFGLADFPAFSGGTGRLDDFTLTGA